MSPPPTVRLPIEAAAGSFLLGTGLGYWRDDATGNRFWWDGQDVWLAPGSASLYAVARGTVRFVPAGEPLPLPEAPDAEWGLLPCVADSLVLEVWPAVHNALVERLPEDAFVPTRIVYQNVDRSHAIDRAVALVLSRPDVHRGFFLREDESTIDDTELAVRVRSWANDGWIAGEGPGVLVDPTDGPVEIGRAAVPAGAAPGLPSDVRATTPQPPGASGWPRVTLKVVSDDGRPASTPFFFHLVARTEDAEWTTRVTAGADDMVLAELLRAAGELRAMRVFHQLQEGWTEGMPVREDMPPALGSLRMWLNQADDSRRLVALIDRHATDPGVWRVQGDVDEGVPYQWSFDGAELYAVVDRSSGTATDATFTPGGLPSVGVRTTRWFVFDGEHRFILGMNFPWLRLKGKWDLGPNEALRFIDGVSAYATPWVQDPANRARVLRDLDNLREMGVRALRMWVFERLEGLRFGYTDPARGTAGATLLEQELARSTPDGPDIRMVQIDVRDYLPSSTTAEMQRVFDRWRGTAATNVQVLPPGGDPSHPLSVLIANAQWLAEQAGDRGIRILWCLWSHWGESRLPDDMSLDDFYLLAGGGRLPIDAWIYRSVMADAAIRRSFVEHAVRPFVTAMEASPYPPLGYEVMNEVDILWEDCFHGWTADLDPSTDRTHFRMTSDQLRTFVRDVAAVLPSSRIRSCSQQGAHTYAHAVAQAHPQFASEDTRGEAHMRWTAQWVDFVAKLRTELDILAPFGSGSPPAPNLSCTGLSKYFSARGTWSPSEFWRRSNLIPEVGGLALPDGVIHGRRVLLTEAGGEPDYEGGRSPALCAEQERVVFAAMHAAMRKGYAGIFLWNYGNPERLGERGQGNSFTERGSFASGSFTPVDPSHRHPSPLFPEATPAARHVKAFSDSYDRYLLPRARRP